MTDFPDGQTPLNEAQMISAMTRIMDGQVDDDVITTFLLNIAERGESVEEITGAARVMRTKVAPINAPEDAIDCCGTGGDKSGTYNISTAVAITAAACGVPVAKHGNRAASSKSGAADVLEALGINLNAPRDILEDTLQKLGFAFLMAPNHHQAMKHVAPIRKKLKTRTIFNVLGPLANPAETSRQLIGVFDSHWVEPLAHVSKNLGTKRAWVVHGSDGLDEITVCGETHIAILDNGHIETKTITPDDFGLPTHDSQDLLGGDAQYNASAMLEIFNGAHNAYRDIVLANTAAVICIHGGVNDLKAATQHAATALNSGAALNVLNDYIAMTQRETA